jgi:alkylation response protein AidB-like acyl-CoA dehydrogenase
MQTKLETARLLTHKAAWTKDRGLRHVEIAARAKLYAATVANEVAYEAVQVLGGWGYMKDHPVERYYRDARVTEIYEGTSEIQRLVISQGIVRDLKAQDAPTQGTGSELPA